MIRVLFIKFMLIQAFQREKISIERKINETLQTKNVSETALLLDLNTFVSDNGFRRNSSVLADAPVDPQKGGLRIPPKYYLPYYSSLKSNMLDMMRQTVYTTQDRMLALEPILKKYEKEPAFRMAFIYNRLKQLIIDMRRVYTAAYNLREQSRPIKRVYEQIYWYSHIVRKYFDVLYIVEHVIDLFDDYAANFKHMKP